MLHDILEQGSANYSPKAQHGPSSLWSVLHISVFENGKKKKGILDLKS